MAINAEKYSTLLAELGPGVQLVAVSKTKPAADIRELYDLGQRDFGENYVQELTEKQATLPVDIRWHFLGHLQSNKVKYIAPFVHLIHGVDSLKLLREIGRQAVRQHRTIDCLLQVHIASEETKFGFDEQELESLLSKSGEDLRAIQHIRIRGLMGMASFTEDHARVRSEFHGLRLLFDKYFTTPGAPPGAPFPTSAPDAPSILSMGMSGDYPTAIAEGSNMVRIGSLLFGERAARIG